MKLFTGSLAAGLVLLAGGAQAQVPGRYMAASDFDAPYAVAPRPAPGPRYGVGPGYVPGPGLLPSTEVYSVLRDNGFLPLGIPRLRGFIYTIAVIDRGGEDGRLVIDARNGRIVRFLPAYRMGDNDYEDQSVLREAPVSPPARIEGSTRPSRPAPPVASRAVPMPKANPLASRPAAVPIKQAAAPAPKPVEAPAAAPVTTGSAPAKPAPQIAPTQDMPEMQGLE
jgi:hypothetical protein